MVSEVTATEDREDRTDGSHEAIERETIYTVDEAINKMGFGPFQVLLTVFCGILWLADSMEFLLLSVLSPAVKCQWGLSHSEEALITSLVFVGFLLGGLTWGLVFDAVGRKRGLFIVNLIVLVFGVLSSLKLTPGDSRFPGYPWLLMCRFGVGFGAGGTGQSVTYYTEFLPLKGRGVCIVLLEVWWAVGSMLGAVLAIGVMRDGGLGWHWLLGFAAIPLALSLFLFPLFPESARFYLVKGKHDKAQKVINRIAWMNCKKAPAGRVVSQEEKEGFTAPQDVVLYSHETETLTILTGEVSNISSYDVQDHSVPTNSSVDISSPDITDQGLDKVDSEGDDTPLLAVTDTKVTSKLWSRITQFRIFTLFENGMWKTTLLLQLLWFGSGWLYYGIVLLTTSLLQYDPHCGFGGNFSNETTCEETQLHTRDYVKILWASAAELPGLLITILIIEFLGRKITMAVEFIGCMIGFLLLFICASEYLLAFFLFLVRAFATGVFQAIYVYTPEVYPTTVRAVGMGLSTSSARVGAIITPFVAQVLLHVNDYLTLSLYAGSCLVFAILSLLLPIETKGRALNDLRK